MKEKLKTAAIVFLLGLMGFQFWFSVNMGLVSMGSEDTSEPEQPGNISISAAALPYSAAVISENGTYAGCGSAVMAIYRKCEPVLKEAVGSVEGFSSAGAEDIEALLTGNALVLEYNRSFPLSLICAWEGSGNDESFSAGGIIVAETDGKVVLAAIGEEGYIMAPTSASPERLAEAVRYENPNAMVRLTASGQLSFEMTERCMLESFAVKPSSALESGELSRDMLRIFGMNPYQSQVYENSMGEMVYVYGKDMLTLKEETVIYTSATGISLTGKNEAERIEQIRRLAQDAWDASGGGGKISFAGSDGGIYRFELCVEGTFVGGDWPVVVDASNGTVTSVLIAPVRFEKWEEIRMLPHDLAAAAAGSDRLRFYYIEQEGILMPILCAAAEVRYGVE